MPSLSLIVLPVTLAVACVGGAIVLFVALRGRGAGRPQGKQATLEMECTICQKQLIFSPSDLVTLSPTEIALVVRLQPALVGKKLFEYVCPYCEASHAFVSERGKTQWVAVNSYNPQAVTANCMECGKRLQRPPWPKGQFDEKLHMLPRIQEDIGMICSRCGARCCVACCKKVTPKDTIPYSCPRCRRSPVERFLHF